jgi:hypothetical protein
METGVTSNKTPDVTDVTKTPSAPRAFECFGLISYSGERLTPGIRTVFAYSPFAIAESLGYYAAPAPFPGSLVMAPLALMAAGSEAQQAEWLPGITLKLNARELLPPFSCQAPHSPGTTREGPHAPR